MNTVRYVIFFLPFIALGIGVIIAHGKYNDRKRRQED